MLEEDTAGASRADIVAKKPGIYAVSLTWGTKVDANETPPPALRPYPRNEPTTWLSNDTGHCDPDSTVLIIDHNGDDLKSGDWVQLLTTKGFISSNNKYALVCADCTLWWKIITSGVDPGTKVNTGHFVAFQAYWNYWYWNPNGNQQCCYPLLIAHRQYVLTDREWWPVSYLSWGYPGVYDALRDKDMWFRIQPAVECESVTQEQWNAMNAARVQRMSGYIDILNRVLTQQGLANVTPFNNSTPLIGNAGAALSANQSLTNASP